MKRAEAPGVVAGSPPRCLYAREVPAVWGDHEDDVLTARARWQEASDSWRASTQGAPAKPLPGGGRRFGWRRDPMSFMSIERLLAVHDLTVDDLPAMAAEARATFPWLWDRSWLPGHERMSAQEFAAWAAGLRP